MAYVVTAPCVGCKSTECAVVCPCECFHEAEHMLVIDPDLCIDCAACATVCPTQAIYPDTEVPDVWQHYIVMNEELSKTQPMINQRKSA